MKLRQHYGRTRSITRRDVNQKTSIICSVHVVAGVMIPLFPCPFIYLNFWTLQHTWILGEVQVPLSSKPPRNGHYRKYPPQRMWLTTASENTALRKCKPLADLGEGPPILGKITEGRKAGRASNTKPGSPWLHVWICHCARLVFMRFQNWQPCRLRPFLNP